MSFSSLVFFFFQNNADVSIFVEIQGSIISKQGYPQFSLWMPIVLCIQQAPSFKSAQIITLLRPIQEKKLIRSYVERVFEDITSFYMQSRLSTRRNQTEQEITKSGCQSNVNSVNFTKKKNYDNNKRNLND